MATDPHHARSTSLRRRLQRAIQYASTASLDNLDEAIGDMPIEIVTPPKCGLLMVNTHDCFETPFYVGEVLVTTVEVQLSGWRQSATVLGDEPRKAVLAACALVLLEVGAQATQDELAAVIERIHDDYENQMRDQAHLAATTRVSFETMVEG